MLVAPCPVSVAAVPQPADARRRAARSPLKLELAEVEMSRQQPRQLESRISRHGRVAFLFAPETEVFADGLPLLLVLHGCWPNRTEQDMACNAFAFRELSQRFGAAVLVPYALQHTWDFVMSQGRASADDDFLSFAINEARSLHRINDSKISVMGFSDGASFGLSLAVANPNLFDAAMLWAAGFCVPPPSPLARPPEGSAGVPRLFLWHGTEDQVFDIDTISKPLRDRLLEAGYEVDYRAEEGGRHICPQPGSEFCRSAMEFWLVGAR